MALVSIAKLCLKIMSTLLLNWSVDDFKYKAPPTCPELFKKHIFVEFTAFIVDVIAIKAPPCSVFLAEFSMLIHLVALLFDC